MITLSYHEEVWMRAIVDAENQVLRYTANVVNGRQPKESVEEYVERVSGFQRQALERLKIARDELENVKSFRTMDDEA